MTRPTQPTLNILLLHARTLAVTLRHEQAAFGDALAHTGCNIKSINLIDHPRGYPLPRNVDAIVIGGSPVSVEARIHGFGALRYLLDDARIRRTPIFAICFGAQFVAKHYGGKVVLDGGRSEHGTFQVRTRPEGRMHPLFADAPESFDAMQSHDDHVESLPPGAELIASSDSCDVQAYTLEQGRIIGTQFHPERTVGWYDQLIDDPELPDERREHYRKLRPSLRDTPFARSLLHRFVDYARTLRTDAYG